MKVSPAVTQMNSVDLASKTALVIDNGIFTHIAHNLADDFGTVLYYVPWENAFPKSRPALIGSGTDKIQRVREFWSHFDQVDIFVFPDVYFGALQEYLRGIGKRVFGAGLGEELELNRVGAKRELKKLGLPVGEFTELIGLDALREHLREVDDKWVKTSRWRGDFETFHHDTYDISAVKLDKIAHDLGPIADIYRFLVEDPIEPAIEIGFDGICADGYYNDPSLFGIEVKDLGFVGIVKPYDELPEQIRYVNEKLRPYMREHQYRGFFSSELRITPDGKPYLIDPCCRTASPPGELYCELYDNLGEIVWYAAEGVAVAPKPLAKYGVEIMLHSQWADKHWMPVFYPKEIEENVKLRNPGRFGERDYSIPLDYNLPEFGAVIGMGDTLEEAIQEATEKCEELRGFDIDPKCEGIQKALVEIERLEAQGIPFH